MKRGIILFFLFKDNAYPKPFKRFLLSTGWFSNWNILQPNKSFKHPPSGQITQPIPEPDSVKSTNIKCGFRWTSTSSCGRPRPSILPPPLDPFKCVHLLNCNRNATGILKSVLSAFMLLTGKYSESTPSPYQMSIRLFSTTSLRLTFSPTLILWLSSLSSIPLGPSSINHQLFFFFFSRSPSQKMDVNCDGVVTLDEFLECCCTDDAICRSLAALETTFWHELKPSQSSGGSHYLAIEQQQQQPATKTVGHKDRRSSGTPFVHFQELCALSVPHQTHLPMAPPQHFHHQNYVEQPVSYFKLANEQPGKMSGSSNSWYSQQQQQQQRSSCNSSRTSNRMEEGARKSTSPPSLVRVRSWYIDKPERISNWMWISISFVCRCLCMICRGNCGIKN